MASKKTIDHLQGADPWANYDPWRKDGMPAAPLARPASHATASQPVTQAQFAALEASMDKKLSSFSKQAGDDANMESSTSHMEARITQLEHQFQHMHTMQASTDAKVSQMQTQLDQQSKMLGDRIDEKLTEQMDRIEQLLCKRSRFE